MFFIEVIWNIRVVIGVKLWGLDRELFVWGVV